MTRMTASEKQTFLAGPHVGVLSIPRPGQGPLTVPVWYDYQPGGELTFLTDADSRKGRLLELGLRISLCAQSEALPYRYVSVEGPVVALEPPDESDGLSMAIRYLGEQGGRTYIERSGNSDSLRVRMAPRNWLAVDYGKSPLARDLTTS